jgi:mRNA interferase RelE/StbE
MYKVEWSERAKVDLAKTDPVKARKIENKVENRLAQDPYNEGKPLVGSRKGQWSFRFSEYRVIYEIKQSRLLILVVEVGHRKEVY